MPSPYLTKTDFKAAFDCATKLYYRRQKYPTTLDENEYMKFLANSGFMVETVAKAQYPQGVDLVDERDPQRAFSRTRELLMASDNAVVFEAAALFGKFYARIDILRREGKTLHLIEVKSSSINETELAKKGANRSPFLNDKGKVDSDWMEYLLDVTFQLHVLKLAFPTFEVKPWLCVINKGCKATANETLAHFTAIRDNDKPKSRPKVNYSGDLEQLKGTSLLTFRDVTSETGLLMDRVVKRADELAALIGPEGQVKQFQETVADLYKTCRKCEFRFAPGKEKTPHGFAECWGSMASAQPHILDMFWVGKIGTKTFKDPVPELILRGKASLLDLKEDQLGAEGQKRTTRRHMQWKHSHPGVGEHLPQALRQELKGHETTPGYPLHFMDFEACDVVLPHHAGLQPYERVAFQWSCHSINQRGELSHQEWLNTERDFPNFTFARTLRDCIGDTGTVYVWSHYEQTTLCKVLKQIGEWIAADEAEALRVSGFTAEEDLKDLAQWLEYLLGPEDAGKKRKNSPRIRDLHELALAHYFHPEMLGRTSIKAVLPAVWRHSSALWQHPWFAKYYRADVSGQALDPYKTLEPLPLGEEDGEGDGDAVREGTGAIRIYQELIFLQGLTEEFKSNRQQLLLQYCELDTAAMVMIWAHWTGYVGAQEARRV